MLCTIKFVYYKSFCVRDDIGSYIRTVYHMVSHTPKRKVGDSNSFWRAINNAESLYFQRFSAFLFFCCGWRFAGKQARKCFCVKRGCGAESPLRAPFRALPFRLWGARSHLQYLNIPPYYDLNSQFAYHYKSLSVCIIDCVYSLRANYKTTVKVVERYAEKYMNANCNKSWHRTTVPFRSYKTLPSGPWQCYHIG